MLLFLMAISLFCSLAYTALKWRLSLLSVHMGFQLCNMCTYFRRSPVIIYLFHGWGILMIAWELDDNKER
jgi:hypothetical protein